MLLVLLETIAYSCCSGVGRSISDVVVVVVVVDLLVTVLAVLFVFSSYWMVLSLACLWQCHS